MPPSLAPARDDCRPERPTQLGVLAKYWQPGKVKTRLARQVGAHEAARLYRRLLELTLRRMAGLADRRVLCFAPRRRRAEMAALAGPSWRLQPQSGGDLGHRMQHYFQTAFRREAGRVVLVGADSPTLPIAYVREALDALTAFPVVLGPAEDGGYYLIGLRAPAWVGDPLGQSEPTGKAVTLGGNESIAPGEPTGQGGEALAPLFEGIDWSTPRVWQQTVARLTAAGIAWAELPRWFDVDTVEDLERLAVGLATELPNPAGKG